MLSQKMRLISLALGLVLVAGCQQTGTSPALSSALAEKPQPPETRPPVSARQYALEQRQARAQAPSSAQQTVITVHLAQEQPEPSLFPVEIDMNQALYALPQPVLTQADMKEVTPVTARDGSTYIMFDLNPQGSTKLANVSEQKKGQFN